ncbi:MAG TPA: NADH-quinone oxidoreductase subunit N [Moorella mulderi]|nr:NADH-quinone oxidoreductase subunit N [Moorella mulderi]
MVNFGLLYMEIATAALGLMLLAWGLLVPKRERQGIAYLTAAGLLALLALAWCTRGAAGTVLPGYTIDLYSIYFKSLFLTAAFLATICSFDYVAKMGFNQGEYYALLVFATLGMMVLATSGELITLYLGLELMAITFYILVAYRLDDPKSAEAGIKYLLLGALSSAILLYGFSLIYGTCGSTVLREIGKRISSGQADFALLLGLIFVIAGFSFKVTAVPFHMWAPDVYEGAPTPITAFLSVGSKAAAFAALIRILFLGFDNQAFLWLPLVTVLSVLSMVLGNLVAIPQKNVKRLLAYSSVAQGGYLLLGIVSASLLGIGAILYYAMIYVFANMGAFMAATAFYNNDRSDEIKDYAGLARRAPLVAAVMLFSVASLAGIPPLAGFPGKLYLFSSVVARDYSYLWLALLGLLMSAVSVYYYLQIVKAMYTGNPAPQKGALQVSRGMEVAMLLVLGILFFLGIYPTPLTNYAFKAGETLFMP